MKKLDKRELGKKCILLPLLVLAGALLGTILLVVAFALPVNLSRYAETAATLDGQASYHSVLDMRNCSYFFSSLPGVLDTATDSLMYQKALYSPREGLLYEAMDVQNYSYYWHGYIVILRALSLFLNYSDVRFLNFILQFLMVFLFAQLLHRRKGMAHTAVFLSSYMLLMPVALFFSMQFSWIFYIALGASFVVLKWSDFWEKKSRYLYLFVGIGVVTCYFDLLTYPLISWAYPMLWWILVADEGGEAAEYVKKVVCSGLSWIFGYGGMWIMKCLLATWILGRDVFGTAVEEVLLRAGVEEEVTWHLRWETILANLEHYKYKLYVIVLVLWLLWFVYKALFYKMHSSTKTGALFLIGVSPLVWYVVLSNHTQVHHFFTYRIFNIGITALLGCMVVVVSAEKQKARFLHLCLAGLLILAATFCSREEIVYGNGAYSAKEDMLLVQGDWVTMEFRPARPRITEFAVQFMPQSEDGALVFRLAAGEKEIYCKEIPFTEFAEDGICFFDVDWNLKKNAYTICLEVQGEGAKGVLSTALSGSFMLEECGQVMYGQTPVEGQLLLCVTYNYRALPKGAELLYTLLAWSLVILPVYFGLREWVREKWLHIRDI